MYTSRCLLISVVLCLAAAPLSKPIVWSERVLTEMKQIPSPYAQAAAVNWIALLDPAMFADHSDDLRELMEAGSAKARQGVEADAVREVLDGWETLRASAARPARFVRLDRALRKFRDNPDTQALYNVVSELRNAAPMEDSEMDAILGELEDWAQERNDERVWGQLALGYLRLAQEAQMQTRADRSRFYADQMAEILRTHPVYQDPKRGNADAPNAFDVVGLLVDAGRLADIAPLSEVASPSHAREYWTATVGHMAERGDFQEASEIMAAHLNNPDDAPVADKLRAALAGEPSWPAIESAEGLTPSTLALSISAIARSHVRQGDSATALRVVEIDHVKERYAQAEICKSLAMAAVEADQMQTAADLMMEGWKRYADEPNKNQLTLGRLATAAVRAGVSDDHVMEIIGPSESHWTVEAILAMARRERESGKRGQRDLLAIAENRAEQTEPGDGGPPRYLMMIAEECHAAGDEPTVNNLVFRAALEAEAMNDAFFFAPGNYAGIIDGCRKMGRMDLVERCFDLLSRVDDRAIFAVCASAAGRE